MGNNRITFYEKNDIDLLRKWADKVYNKNKKEHREAKNKLLQTASAKTVYWSEQVVAKLKGYNTINKKVWHKRDWTGKGRNRKRAIKFKSYLWAKIFKEIYAGRGIFFTVSIDAKDKSLIYKIDYDSAQASKLTSAQKNLCKQLVPNKSHWKQIRFTKISNYSWDKLINVTVRFIKANESKYKDILKAVNSENIKNVKLHSTLVKCDIPKNGIKSIPKTKHSFEGHDVDWINQQKRQKKIGAIGEQLVLKYEKKKLRDANKSDLAKCVKKVKDGIGYDIESRSIDGTKKYIEVKTTTGGKDTNFIITDNEVAFSKENKKSYYLYRVFNLNKKTKAAQFHLYHGDIDKHFLFKGKQFMAYRKNRK